MKALLAKAGTRSSSAPARRAGATSTFPAARKPPTFTSASTGCRSVSFGHTSKIGKRVIVLGGGNTAMDCCRSSKRLGGEEADYVFLASGSEGFALEKEDAMHEGIPIHNYLVPKEFTHENGKLTGVTFEKVKAEYDAKGRRKLVNAGEPDQHFPCDDVLVAVGQRTFPGSSATPASSSTTGALVSTKKPFVEQPESVFRRRRGLRPEEHHLGGGARPRGRGLDRQDAQRRGHHRPPAAGGRADEPEDGHPRMVLRQRDRTR